MPVKFTGKQFKDFWNAEWGPEACIEDEMIKVDGVEYDTYKNEIDAIPDTAAVTLVGGFICPDQSDWKTTFDAERFARKWLKDQTTVTLLLEIDRAHAGAWQTDILAAAELSGRKVKIVGP